MQSAIDAAAAYDGQATVWLTEGKTYRCNSQLDLSYCSGVTFAGGGTLHTTDDYGIFCAQSDGDYAEQLISEADEGDTFVTTTSTPSGLSAGDYVLIYTGQTNAGGSGAVGTADSEINQVVSIDGNTVNLVSALAKDYRQESYDVGEGIGSGSTSIGGAGDPAPLALRKIDPARNITLDGIIVDHDGTSAFLAGHNIVNLTITDVTAVCVGSFISISGWTGSTTGCDITVTTEYAYWWAVGYGARDVTLSNSTLTNPTLGYLHIHEGASSITVQNVTCTSGEEQTGTSQPIIGLRARGYNITLDTVTVTNAPNASGGACLRVDPGVTGTATDCVFDITNGGDTDVVNNSGGTFTVA